MHRNGLSLELFDKQNFSPKKKQCEVLFWNRESRQGREPKQSLLAFFIDQLKVANKNIPLDFQNDKRYI